MALPDTLVPVVLGIGRGRDPPLQPLRRLVGDPMHTPGVDRPLAGVLFNPQSAARVVS